LRKSHIDMNKPIRLPDLGVYTQLTKVNLRFPSVTLIGNIPDMSACPELRTFCLSGAVQPLGPIGSLPRGSVECFREEAALTGTIPDFSACTQLQEFDLACNKLTGNIPNMSPCTQLRVIVLAVNELSGIIPGLSACTQLITVNLTRNRLIGSIPGMSACTQLREILLDDNQLTGAIPDFSACVQLKQLCLSRNDLETMPLTWPVSLISLDVSCNPRLAGCINAALIIQCNSICYGYCRPRWDKQLGQSNAEWMTGPFIIGVSFASEDIEDLTVSRRSFDIMDSMLIDPPKRGDTKFEMERIYGPGWVSWQEVWLVEGLRKLRNRHVIVAAASDNFERKFKQHTTDDENAKNFFQATYELQAGERADCILDWERRHVTMCAKQNNLQIWFIGGAGFRESKPGWYPLPRGLDKRCNKQINGQSIQYEWDDSAAMMNCRIC